MTRREIPLGDDALLIPARRRRVARTRLCRPEICERCWQCRRL